MKKLLILLAILFSGNLHAQTTTLNLDTRLAIPPPGGLVVGDVIFLYRNGTVYGAPYTLFSGGTSGTAGATGATGATGLQGPIGLTGPSGPQGVAGATGPQGPIGLTGATGASGSNGAQGIQGLQGIAGATGAIGPAGPTGPAGSGGGGGAATPINWRSTWQPNTAYAIGDAVSNAGSSYYASVAIPGAATFNPASWNLIASVGSIGATGPSGAQGIAGASGATGATGAQGSIGLTGAAGAAGTNGTNGAAGPTGATGATGAQGVAGVAGATGPAGPAGAVGATGATGATGPTGPAGSGGSTSFTRSVYTASGAIALTDTLSILNCSAACTMTLANGTTDGQGIWLIMKGVANATLTGNFDYLSSGSLPFTAGASVPIDKAKLRWSTADATWFVE